MKKGMITALIITIIFTCSGCAKEPEEKEELLFYIGITMVKPVEVLAREFEEDHNCKIQIVQGGSQDLYDSLSTSQKGDLYMPGSYSYRKNNIESGLLQDAVFVGYNKAAIVVAKGNPLGYTGDLSQLSDPNNRVVICNPDSGSIGRETKKVLEAYGNYEEVFDNAIYLTTDSRNLTDAIASGDADVLINWYATSVWEENVDKVESIVIDEQYAQKKMLIMSLTSVSEHPELTKEFMEYASSEHGQEVFKKYGFLDEEDIENFDGVEFE